MEFAHTGAYIRSLVDDVLAEWEIDSGKVIASLTDNGSNMVAAFRMRIQDLNDVEEDLEDEEQQQETDDFEDRESDHIATFSTLHRISCFTHTLQLVVSKFSQITAFKAVLGHAYALLRRVNSSVKATERLVSLCNKKLVRDCPTRWSSTFLMINRMLEVRNFLSHVLEELEWDNLAVSEWKVLQSIRDLLQPFAMFTTLVQGEEFTTVSCVIPAIMDLTLYLEECRGNPEMSEAAQLLLSELKRRFRKYTNPNDGEYEPLFIVGTALDQRYRLVMNAVQIQSAKKHICKMMKEAAKEKNAGVSSTSECDSPSHETATELSEEPKEPPTKRFRHLNRILEAKLKEGLQRTSRFSKEKAEVEQYFQTVESTSEKIDPIDFWISQEQRYPSLSSLAVDILTIPGSSAPVERIFLLQGNLQLENVIVCLIKTLSVKYC